jgi:hypothetical protein
VSDRETRKRVFSGIQPTEELYDLPALLGATMAARPHRP